MTGAREDTPKTANQPARELGSLCDLAVIGPSLLAREASDERLASPRGGGAA